MKLTKRILSLLLVLAMVLSVLPMTLFADETEPTVSYELATAVAAGDKIVVVAQYDSVLYALTNDNSTVSNALLGTAVTLTEGELEIGEADVVWEVAAGAEEGNFVLKNASGQAITYGGSGTSLGFGDTGADLKITVGAGTSVLEYAGNSTRNIFFRMNNNQPQFRMYSTNNLTASGYSSVLSIYKQVVKETEPEEPVNPDKPAEANIAPKATAEKTDYCASWNNVAGVNDGILPPASLNGDSVTVYGSWGTNNNNNPEPITLTWNTEVELVGAGLYFWYNDNNPHNHNGIDLPESYSFEYLDADGETWKAIENVTGALVGEDVVNVTLFEKITTKSLRVLLNKGATGSFGLGVAEFEAYGELLALDTAALEAAIAEAEAITNLDNYTDETVAALTEALAAAKAVLAKEDKTQAEIDEAAAALTAAIAALAIKPVDKPAEDNIAPQGTATATYCASWNRVTGVNDGLIPSASRGADSELGATAVYGSWGANNNANPEPITITFEKEAEITGAGMYFWTDQANPFSGGGVNFPASYTFEYLDGEDWKPVENARGMNNEADKVNYSVFDKVTTTALRVVMNKASTGSFGLGVAEFEIYGTFAGEPVTVDTTELERVIADAEALNADEYTEETWAALQTALTAAKEVLAKEDKTQEEVDEAARILGEAIENLSAKPEEPEEPETTYEAIGELANLTDGKYIITLWRYLGADGEEGFLFHSENNNSLPAAITEDHSKLTNEAIAETAIWEIKVVEGGYTIQNVGTGKYLGDAVPAASDEPVVHPIVEGTCNGVHDYAIGNSAGTGSLRYSGSSGSFSFNTTAPSTEVNRAWAANVLLHKVVEPEPVEMVTAYEAIGELANLTDGDYILSLWRYLGADGEEGFIFHSENNNSMPAAITEDHSELTNEAIAETAIWEIKVVEGGYTIMNKGTGKYLGDAVPAASDEPVVHPIVEGTCNGVHDYAVGNSAGTGSLRYSGSSGSFSFNTTAPSTEVNRAWAANVLIHKVVEKPAEEPVEVDTTALETAIAAAKAVEADKYTEESIAALNEALAAAEAVLAKEDKTQEEVDAAAAALNAAVAALVEKPAEPELVTYELTKLEDLNEADTYIITVFRYFAGTNTDSHNAYVLNGNDNKCGGVNGATSDDYATMTAETAFGEAAQWKIVPVEGGLTIQNVATGKYLGNAIPAASDEPVTLVTATGAVNGVTNYGLGYDANHYLRYSGSSDSFSWSSGTLSSAPNGTNACNVLFYKAPAAEMEPVQMFAGSDIQGASDWNQHLDNIAKNAYDAGNDINVSFWCGDYADGSVYADGSNTSATETPQRIQYIKDTLGKYWPDLSDYHFAQGNHDGSQHIGTVIDPTGPKEYDEFVLYQINEDDFPWWQAGYSTYSSEDTCLEKINATTTALGAYLDDLIAKKDTRVIFIYTHVPLHWTSRTTTYNSWWSDNIHADILFNMINEKAKDLDIVFLYGHNHSESYPDAYPAGGTVNFFAPGDEIRIPNGVVAAGDNYTTEIINFTYLNAGYVGQTASGFNPSVATASVITVKSDRVEFTRYSDAGHYEGSDRVLLRNNRDELPVYMNLNSVENPKVRKEGDTEHFQAVLKNAEAASYTWSVEGNGEITDGQGTDTAAVTYTGGETVTVKVVVTYVDGNGETQSLEQTKTVEVKAAPQQGEITYNEVKSVADLAEGKQYAIVAWRYFGGSDDDTFNGYGFGSTNAVAYRAPTEDNYETIKPEAELTDDQLWEIVPVEGGVTLKNLGTGKYLAEAIPAAADEPYTLTIAEGECNGVYNVAIGTASGSIRYSGSSGTFGYSTTAPSGEVTRAWAANLTIYEKVVPAKVYPNIAPLGTASSAYVSSWCSVEGVNDEVIPDSSNPGYDYNEAYGSWGANNNSNPETILITFEQPAKLYGAGAFFWYNADGPHNQNGIDIPASYTWEYQNAAGEWVEFPNAAGFGIEEDIMNQTTFDPVLATVVRINMAKSTTGSYGLGVAELELYGELVEPVDTTALEAAIAAAEAIENLEEYTEDSAAALTEALEAAKAELDNVDKTQESVDAAAEALNAAIAALKLKPLPNIAPEAIDVEAPNCASWNNLAGVNDGVLPSASNTASDNTAYGSWRSNATADPELITFTFEKPAEIRGASAYFLYNENSPHEQLGVDFPDSYTFEYLNDAGQWVEVPNATGYGLEEDILNQTSFDSIVTTAFRIVMQRQAGTFGLGVGEIEIYGQYVTEYIDKTVLAATIAEAEALTETDWTPESWAQLAEVLAAAKEVYANAEATQEEVDAAAEALRNAIDALVDKVQAVIDLIDAIEEPYGLEDKEAIEAAREAYDALTEEEQERVDNYADLLLAEVAYYEALIAKYEEEKEKYEEEIAKALADAKQAAIDALTEYLEHAKLDHDDEHVAAAEEALAAAIEAINAAEDSEALRKAVDDGIAAIDEALKGGETNPDDPDNPDDPFRFDDVQDENQYYFEPVYWAYNAKPQITSGTSETLFSPNNTCTRGQVVTFLWRAAGEPEPTLEKNPFDDVAADQYYYKAVLWAVEKGITTGTSNTTFSPNGKCTRGQVVTFLYRSAGEPEPGSSENPFTDVSDSQYYYKAVLWAVEKGITQGTSNTTFTPNGTCTRAQVVTFLYRHLADKE